MAQSRGRWLRVGLAIIGLVGFVGCDYESAGVAAGLTAQSLPKLRLGMSGADVHRVLGPPLTQSLGPPNTPRRLIYARSRRMSIGDGRHVIAAGQACGVLLEEDAESEAYFIDTKANVMCFCRPEACEPEWASPCLPSLR